MNHPDQSKDVSQSRWKAIVGNRALWLGGLFILLLMAGKMGWISSVGAAMIALGAGAWLILEFFRRWGADIDANLLLTSEEKLQNKDCRAIVTISSFALLVGLCVVYGGADILFAKVQEGTNPPKTTAAPYLALLTALASVAVGGAFGFLLGHPRRLGEDAKGAEGRSSSSWLLKTGLDDIVDWLVKGITTVLLVKAHELKAWLDPITQELGKAFQSGGNEASGQSFAYCIIIYFSLFGAGAACLVTRTYLTGALGRADRSATKEFAFGKVNVHWGEVLILVNSHRFVGRENEESADMTATARKIGALSLADLRTPQEIALWAKAKFIEGDYDDACIGYEKAILMCDCDPELRLDYAVALHAKGDNAASLRALEVARRLVSRATPGITVKNIYKSLTYALLFDENQCQRVLDLCEEISQMPGVPFSGGIAVNRVCAQAGKFRLLAKAHALLPPGGEPWSPQDTWPESMRNAYDAALEGIHALLKIQPSWRSRFEVLMTKAFENKNPSDNDLEVFESFPEFRLAVGLAPLPDEPPTAASPSA